MTENLFPFMFWGLGSGFAHNKWPGNSDGVLSGGSPRYNIYKTSDGNYVAAAPLEDRFWNKFCEAIELPKKFIKMQNDQEKVIKEIRKIIGQKEKNYWLDVFNKADCCCSIVKSIEEAINDNHFKVRKIFENKIINNLGEEIPALPIPVDMQFRKDQKRASAPSLGDINDQFF